MPMMTAADTANGTTRLLERLTTARALPTRPLGKNRARVSLPISRVTARGLEDHALPLFLQATSRLVVSRVEDAIPDLHCRTATRSSWWCLGRRSPT